VAAAKILPGYSPKTRPEVLELFALLQAKSTPLQGTYFEILRAMGLDISNPDFTFYNLPLKRELQPWEIPTDDSDYTVMVHRLHQIVEDQRTVLGAERSVQCLPPVGLFTDDPPSADPENPALTAEDKAQEYADMLERACLHLWREWQMVDRYSLMGYLATLLGEAVGVLFWSDKRNMPIFQVRSPVGFYPQASVDDPARLTAAIFEQVITGAALYDEYPDRVPDSIRAQQRVYVYDYYDEHERIRVARDLEEPLLQVPNPLGRVPVYIFPGILVPGIRGASAMQLAIPSHNEMQRLYALEAYCIDKAVHAPIIINDAQNVPENPVWGPNSIWTVGPQGKVGVANFNAVDMQLLDRRISDFKESVNSALDFSPIAGGDTEGTQMTGKGVTAVLNPKAARQQIRVASMNCRMELVMEDAFRMWKLKATGRKPVAASGFQRGSQFSVQINPRDFKDDWLKVRVFIDSAAFVDRQAAMVGNLQKLRGQPQAMSLRRFLELDPDCPDVAREMAQIAKERDDAMKAQIAAMQPQGPVQLQAQSEVSQSPEQTMYASERGAPVGSGGPQTGPASPAPSATLPGAGTNPGGGSPTGQSGPTPNDNQATLEALAEAFRNIKKIKGQVFLCGLAATGDISAGIIEVYLTDPADKATINNAWANDPDLKQLHADGALHFYDVPPKSGDALEVTPGTDGTNLIPSNQIQEEVGEGGEQEQEANPNQVQ